MMNVDISKLKRDYVKNPLKRVGKRKIEKPCKEDLEYLYIEENLTLYELSMFFNVSEMTMRRMLAFHRIKKSDKLWNECLKRTMKQKYGVENASLDKNMVEKRQKTLANNWGVSCYLKSDICKEKTKKHNLKKYGVDYFVQTDEFKDKAKESWVKNYGVDNPFKSKEIKDKIKRMNFEKYGFENYSKTKKFRYYMDKNREEINQKIYQTKRNNCTFNSSKPEKDIERILKEKYPQTKIQYKSESYPFNCDFYIPEIDTYIEYQGTWFHGGESYIGTNEQKEKLKLWETKLNSGHKSYSRAIRIWNEEDVLKRRTAQQNNLNYLEFFNMRQFMDWFNRK